MKVSHNRPAYKAEYEYQLKVNKGLLIPIGICLAFTAFTVLGSMRVVDNKNAEISSLQRELDRTLVIAAKNIDDYNLLLEDYASCSAKLKEKKISSKARSHIKQQPIVAEKIKAKFGDEWAEATELFSRESSLNPLAINPSSGACGIVQALPCSKLVNTCSLSDIDCQLEWGKNYIKNRYGSASKALAFHDEKNWY